MPELNAKLFGTPAVSVDGREITLPYKKADALLYYLILKRKTTRSELIGLLYEDTDSATALKNLRHAIYTIRKAFAFDPFVPGQRSISNWTSFYGVSDIGPDFSEDQCGSTIWPDVEKFWWHSPMKYADKVKTPTLFLHSLEDYRCPVDQGYQMYSALIAHGVESRLVLFRGENHELSRSGKPKHRIRRLNEITGWFEQHKG